MKIGSPFNQALLGIQRGLQSASQHAADISSATAFQNRDTAGLTGSMVGLVQDRLQVAASTEVLKAADEMIGSLFDEKT